MCTKFWLEYLKGRDHLEDLVVGGEIILNWIDIERVLTGFIRLMIQTGGRLL
jgi:hypothetical protein